MIAGCPRCGARYRIDPTRVKPEGVRLRCSKCEAVFRIAPPPQERPQEAATVRPLVLVADSDVDAGKRLASTLAGWGYEPLLVHDGVEAMLTIQRSLPRAVILDAGLPKMFGFQVCEIVKRNESLRSIHVVLVGAIHDQNRYRRAPNELYGADAYVERPQLPEALRPILRSFDLESPQPAAETPTPKAVSAPAPVATRTPAPQVEAPPAATPEAPGPAPAAPASPPPGSTPRARTAGPAAAAPEAQGAEAAVARAERLARIIISDIVLYNEEKFAEGIRSGDVAAALASELDEGRSHFDQRVEPQVRGTRDFLTEELLRVARKRGMDA